MKCTKAPMIPGMLLASERQMVAVQIASLLRQHEEPVLRPIARYQAEGTVGLYDAPCWRAPPKVTHFYRDRLLEAVRRRPRKRVVDWAGQTGQDMLTRAQRQGGWRWLVAQSEQWEARQVIALQ